MESLKRYDIINAIIFKRGYKSYLEIGTQGDYCISRVKSPYKVGVDPKPVTDKHDYEFHLMTSDDYFNKNMKTFDIIFIDGLHYSTQVIKDVYHSLRILSDGGTILCHDCNPQSEERQVVPERHMLGWNGDVWKAWVALRNRSDLEMWCFNLDEGVGIIRRGAQKPVGVKEKMLDLTYASLEANRQEWLNLVDFNYDLL